MIVDPVDQLDLALEASDRVIAAITGEQWLASTPCPEWSVRDLAFHLVTGNLAFVDILRGRLPHAGSRDPGGPEPDVLSAYRASADELLAAFRRPGVLGEVFTVPFGTVPGIAALHLRTTEVLVHGWDLAHATDQDATFPDDVAEAELTFSRAKLTELPPDRHPFGPPQAVADDAPAIERLAACLGRTVGSPS